MKPMTPSAGKPEAAYALMIVMIFTGLTLLVLVGTLSWCQTNANLTDRNNQYFTTMAAAEAATEKVLANLSRDYQSQGESLVAANLEGYRALTPVAGEQSGWANFRFSSADGASSRTTVEKVTAATYTPLQSQYSGIYGLASTYRVISNARMLNTAYTINAALKQDVQLASIPVFQFAIFYSMPLEINPGANMTVTGRVHGNAEIYTQPVSTLTFQSHVTAVGKIISNKSPDDPSARNLSNSHVVYQGEHDANVSSLNLPIGTNNTADAVQAIVNIPPDSEAASSLMGQQRYYNKADLIVLVSNSTTVVKSGRFNNFATTIASGEWNKFLNTNVSFFNKREAKTIKSAELDVAALKTWSQTNTTLQSVLGRDLRSIYVADMRTQSASTEAGVRVKNGQTLPSLGLTVATPNPLYVKGHYNAPAAFLGTTNTSTSLPASLVGDSITVQSSNWSDANAGSDLSSRTAGNTTVNAAFLAGIVPSGGGNYSGGVENFPRFLENWGGKTLTYNGSMVVMFNSKTATAPWGGNDVYSPPTRQWTFDLNFLDATRLPPGTPEVRALVRGQWAAITPGANY